MEVVLRHNESVQIGPDITLTLIALLGQKCRLGIKARPNVAIDRLEIHEAKKRARQAGTLRPKPR